MARSWPHRCAAHHGSACRRGLGSPSGGRWPGGDAGAFSRRRQRPARGQATKEAVLGALFTALQTAGNDRFLEHALIFAAIRIDDSGLTAPFLTDGNPQVRRAALIALDQMDHGQLTREQVAHAQHHQYKACIQA